jgi:hypothetical protein
MKRLAYIAAFVFVASAANAQYNMDYGFRVGGTNYLGEMGGKEETRKDFVWDMKLNQTRWALGGFFRYKLNPLIGFNVGLTYGRIQGSDALSDNPGRVGRNLHFRNDLFELYGRTEVYFFSMNDVGNRGRYRMDFKAYAFAGLAGFYHNPKAQLDGTWYSLRDYQTEGVSYGKFGLGVPGGLGFYFTHKRKHRFGWELSLTTTFTDYLDDVSTVYKDPAEFTDQTGVLLANRSAELDDTERPHLANYAAGEKRGDPSHNDTYTFMTFYYSYVIKGPNSFYRQNYGWLSGRRGRIRKVRAKF